MKIIAPIVRVYEKLFRNEASDAVLATLNSKELRLFRSLQEKEIDDSEAYDLIYNGKSKQAYNQFKVSLIHKLCQVIVNYDSDQISETQREIIRANRGFTAVKILQSLGMASQAASLAEKTLKKTKHYNLNVLNLELSRILAVHYLMKERKVSKANIYKGLHADFMKRVQLEHESEFMNAEIVGSANPLKYADIAAENVEYLSKYLDVDSHRFRIFYHYMKVIANADDKRGMIEAAEEGLKYFTELHYDHVIAKNMFRLWLVRTHLQLMELDKVKFYINESVTVLKNGTQRNFLMRDKIKVHLFLGEFVEADRGLVEVMDNSMFRFNHSIYRGEIWELKLYRYLVAQLGYLPKDNVTLQQIRNNLSRNTTENVGQFIAFFLIGILEEGLDYAIEHEEELDSWIRKKVSKRTKLFLKQLKQLAHSKYSAMDDRYLDKLAEHPHRLQFDQQLEEVVVYEELWGMVRSQIKNYSHLEIGINGKQTR